MQNNQRRLDRARAFQVLYSVFFVQPKSQRELGRLYQKNLYSNNLPAYNPLNFVESVEEDGRIPINFTQEDELDIETPFANAETNEGFAWELVQGVWNNSTELDKLIAGFSQNWRIDRIGKVELALLRLAIYELMYRDDVPPKVIINEAIELSKHFGEEGSHSFINGILDAAIKNIEAGSIKRGSTVWGHKPQFTQ